MKDAALWYAQHGFPVFPVHNVRDGRCSCSDVDCAHLGKHPRTLHGFKDATKDPAKVGKWWAKWPDANIGIPTGPASGLLAIDIDPRNGGDSSWESLVQKHGPPPPTAEQMTGGGGRHIVFRDPGVPIPKELSTGIDLKGAGGYIIVAPSIHSSGRPYNWDGIDGEKALLKLAPVPLWLLIVFAAAHGPKRAKSAAPGKKWNTGERNSRLTSLAGVMRRGGATGKKIEAALLRENAFRCEPPLPEAEVRRIAQSVAKYPPGTTRPKKKGRVSKEPIPSQTAAPDRAEAPTEDDLNQAQILISLAADAKLFHTPNGEAFAQILVDDHNETLLLNKRVFKAWLVRRFYQECEKPPGSQALQGAIGVLEAKALIEGPEAPLFVRVAEYDGRIYIDLCDKKWRVVEISPQGWRITSDPPIHFRRAGGMKSLPLPVTGGSINQLRAFLNIGGDANWILCICWLVATCRAQGPFPILILQGEQGSAKSTMVKLLRLLIDPSCALVRTPPRDSRDLAITANNSWVLAYDNLSGILPWLSDSFCRLATGEGFSTRALYTNDEEVFFDSVRPIVLNGIDHLAERADLAERALILHLPPIPNENRRDEAQLYADFDRQLPQILGALFSAVSTALARLPHTKLARMPRMADFAIWASAAEEGLGFAPGSFMRVYARNRAEAVQETLEADPVGAALLAVIEKLDGGSFEGTYKELFLHLEQHIDEGMKKSREWPKSARGLSGRLRRLVTFLREAQIQVVFHPRGAKGQRTIAVSRTGLHSTVTSVTTVTSEQDHLPNQPATATPTGDGPIGEVTEQDSEGDGRSPASLPGNSLTNIESRRGLPKVTEVTVDCSTDLQGNPSYLCPNCGRVDWVWDGSAWVCPTCGTQSSAPGSSSSGIECFEL